MPARCCKNFIKTFCRRLFRVTPCCDREGLSGFGLIQWPPCMTTKSDWWSILTRFTVEISQCGNLNQSFRIYLSSLCSVFWDDFIFIKFRNRLTFHIEAYFDFALINSLTEKNTLENENKKINIFSSSYLSIMETVFYFFKEGSYTTSYYLKLRNSSSNHAWFKIYPNIPFSKIRKFCLCLNSWRHHGHIKSHRTHLFIYLFFALKKKKLIMLFK